MKNNIKISVICMAGLLAMASCSDGFLEDKKNYDNVNSDIYNYYSGCNGRVNDIYSWCLPTSNDMSWKYPSMGNADIAGQSTEEYSGFSDFVNPDIELSSTSTTNQVPDYFMATQSNIQEAVYGRIRNINDVIEGINGGKLSQDQKNILLGQCYFFRAWCYYNIVKWYGGVPIVTETQDPVVTSVTPRSSTKASIEFILSDLDKAASLLASKTMSGGWSGDDYGRVTTGTAQALKGRVLLLWASPIFNRANDEGRWTKAYTVMKQEMDSIKACGYGLYQGSGENAQGFANMFTQSAKNPEAVFVTLYNNVIGDGLDNQKNNTWEKSIRPKNAGGSGMNASAMLVDMFPMKDGKIPSGTGTYSKLVTSDDAYDAETPFLDRDPRFYRTFTFPGFRWAYNGDYSTAVANNPSDGKNFVLWNYVWYTSLDDQANVESGNSYGADNLLTNKSGVYVRKKTDDLDANGSPLYTFVAADVKGAAPYYSAAPLLEIRFAEVLLNFAEAACGAGHLDEAVAVLKQIRERVGYTGDCGLQANLSSDQAACMSAILYERQIEFAYEGKRFDDMRRWMLFDGGAQKVAGSPASWTLTGWGGNTCTWLGFKPFNGQRRENMEFRVADKYGVGGTTYDSDPMVKAGVTRPAGVDLRKPITDQVTQLATWYKSNLKRKLKKGDGYNAQHVSEYMNFRPNYYLLGLCSGASSANKALPQTIGWADYNKSGSAGTFDPLAE